MSILKSAKSQAQAAAQVPAFEAGEDRGGDDVAVAEREDATQANAAGANTGVQDVQHTETVVERKQPEPEVKQVSEQAAAGAAAALKKAATPKQEAKAEAAPAEQAAAPAAEQTTAVAVPQRKILSTFLSAGKDIPNPLADLKNAFMKAGIDIDYSTFQRVRPDTGVLSTPDGKEAGSWIELAIVSYGSSWTIGTGTDDEESKKHVRFSMTASTSARPAMTTSTKARRAKSTATGCANRASRRLRSRSI
jgi:hypothetical protein